MKLNKTPLGNLRVEVYTDASVDHKEQLGAGALYIRLVRERGTQERRIRLSIPPRYCCSSNIAELYTLYRAYNSLEQTSLIPQMHRVDVWMDNIPAINRGYGINHPKDFGPMLEVTQLIADFYKTVAIELKVGIQKVHSSNNSIHGLRHQTVHDMAIEELRRLRQKTKKKR